MSDSRTPFQPHPAELARELHEHSLRHAFDVAGPYAAIVIDEINSGFRNLKSAYPDTTIPYTPGNFAADNPALKDLVTAFKALMAIATPGSGFGFKIIQRRRGAAGRLVSVTLQTSVDIASEWVWVKPKKNPSETKAPKSQSGAVWISIEGAGETKGTRQSAPSQSQFWPKPEERGQLVLQQRKRPSISLSFGADGSLETNAYGDVAKLNPDIDLKPLIGFIIRQAVLCLQLPAIPLKPEYDARAGRPPDNRKTPRM